MRQLRTANCCSAKAQLVKECSSLPAVRFRRSNCLFLPGRFRFPDGRLWHSTPPWPSPGRRRPVPRRARTATGRSSTSVSRTASTLNSRLYRRFFRFKTHLHGIDYHLFYVSTKLGSVHAFVMAKYGQPSICFLMSKRTQITGL